MEATSGLMEVIVRIRLSSGKVIELTAEELRELEEFTVGDLDLTNHILIRINSYHGGFTDERDLPVQPIHPIHPIYPSQ
jgi:hypothetical protein